MMLLPPALLLVAGAALVAVAPRAWRAALAVLVPLATLAYLVVAVPDGATLHWPFLSFELEVLRADRLSLLFAGIFCLIGAIAGLYAWQADDGQRIAALLYTAGAVGVTFAGDLFTLYVFWELLAVTAVVLVWARRTRVATRAGMRYLLVHLAGGGILLFGILLHVNATGSLAFRAFDAAAPTAAAWLILLGFCVNAAVPPLGAWLPDAYPRATVSGAVFLSALTTKTAVYTLLRGFAGWEILVPLGVLMTLYGVMYAVLANDIRTLLAYHIISQVGYMVAGAGLGTPLAINGAAAHAVCHILYKALLFMGAGAVLATTGRSHVLDLGGFARRQPWVVALYMIGAFSISGVPLWNGFISKSMVIAAAGEAHRDAVYLLLMLASVGTFLSVGLKLPYATWFGPDRGIRPTPTPKPMIAAMAIAAALCTLTGIAPGLLYRLLPYATAYDPFTATHLVETVQLLLFTFFAFAMFLPNFGGERTIALDTDVFYRAPAAFVRRVFVTAVAALFGAAESAAERLARAAAQAVRNPTAWGSDGDSAGPDFDPDLARPPLITPLVLTVVTFVAVALALLSWRV